MTLRSLIPAAVLAVLLTAAPAHAHIQVSPSAAAPGDSVLFELLVPNERTASTTRVDLKVPDGVLPFSFEATPGWQRTMARAPGSGATVIRWTGRLAHDGFVRFSFLAATPDQAGTIAWKAIQTYADGKRVRWIGAPGTEHPAATTRIARGVPAANAGGEGASPAPDLTAPPAATADSSSDGNETLRLLIAGAGMVFGGAALWVALRGRRAAASSGHGDEDLA